MKATTLALVLAIVLSACPPAATPTPTATPIPTPTPFPNSLDISVDIGGHQLPIKCRGSGEPTIILENGLDTPSWGDGDLGRFKGISRTCRYVRVGMNGDDLTHPRTPEDQVKDLHDLLEKVGVPKPYILVGHSIAGYNLVLFTFHYPVEVVGLVCVDCRPPSYDNVSDFGDSSERLERLDGIASQTQAQKVTSLGDLPFVVLVSGDLSRESDWASAQESLSKLSTRGRMEIVPGTSHMSIIVNDAVDKAIKEVMQDIIK